MGCQGYRAGDIRIILVLFFLTTLNLDPCLALSLSNKSPTTTSRSATTTSVVTPISRPSKNNNKPWRYSQPKASKWDIRHTKSFRFQIQIPVAADDSSSSNHNLLEHSNNNFERLPLHKKPRESLSHVLGKGLLWALFKDQYAPSSPSSSPYSSKQIFVETPIPGEDRFVPDVVAFDYSTLTEDGSIIIGNDSSPSSSSQNHPAIPPEHQPQRSQSHYEQPTFWGESGRMSADKAASLAWKYPHTHFVHLRWGYPQVTMDIFEEIEDAVLPAVQHRTAPFEFCLLPGQPKDYLLLSESDDKGASNDEESTTVSISREDCLWRTARFDIDINY